MAGVVLFPIVHFYLLEAYTHNGFVEVRPWAQLFNILLFELTAWILAFLIWNIKWALRVQALFAMVFGLVNYYVYAFRSMPLVPWDLFSIGTAASVAGNYQFMPEPRVWAVLAGFLLVLFLERFCHVEMERKRRLTGPLLAVALGAVTCLFAHVLQQEEFQNRHGMYNKLFTPVYLWKVNGFALTMVMELPYLAVEKPQGYDRGSAQEMLRCYETSAGGDDMQKTGISGKMPHIIVIMDEAFSDLGVLGDFTVNEDYMPFFRSMAAGADNTVTGDLHVSVCGGNTANTEFEFLTGNTMAFLPQGSIPYQQYIHSEIPALPAYLSEMGYATYAMHPYQASGWERDTVYPMLGFDSMQFILDYSYREYVRDYVSDRTCVDQIIRTYEQREEGKPIFVFNVTMQNHGSYGDLHENFAPNIMVDGVSSNALSTYLSLIQKTDEALEHLITYFSNQSEPVMVVFFGDHQPNDAVAEPILRLNGKSSRTLSEEDTRLRYQVPYLIWANYEIESQRQADMSVNYLGGKVLELAGLELPAYQNFLKEFSKSYPVLSAVQTTEAKERAMDMEDYKKLQYYQLFDVKGRGNET